MFSIPFVCACFDGERVRKRIGMVASEADTHMGWHLNMRTHLAHSLGTEGGIENMFY